MHYRLTPKQADILSCAMLQAEASCAEISRQAECREQTVRSCLRTLQEKHVIQAFPLINCHPMGYTDYCLFFSQCGASKSARKALLQALIRSPLTAWVAELGGEFQYTASLLAKDIFQVAEFLKELGTNCGGGIFEKSFAVRASWTSFSCSYLSSASPRITQLTRAGGSANCSLDLEDHQILCAMARNPEMNQTELSRLLKIPPSTLTYRLKTLKQKKILLGQQYFLDAGAIGMHAARLLVYERYSNPDLTKKLFAYAKSNPFITGFVHCIGAWDYELNVEVPDPRNLAEITEQLFNSFGDSIETVKVLSLLQTVKICLYPFSPQALPA